MSLQSSLAWLGRQGTRAAAASIFVGLAIPPLAAALKPIFTLAIFLLLVFSFLRVDPEELRARFRSPGLVVLACLGIMVLTPVLFGFALPYTGIDRLGPGVALGLMMYLAAPPIMASTAFAALLRLDTALTLAVLIACTALTPLLAPLIVSSFAADSLQLDAAQLVIRLFAILGGAFAMAWALRYFLGTEKISENKATIDGISVLLLTALLFWRQGLKASLALGFSSAHRNMGVMIAAAGSGLPELTWIYFAVAQFPIYLLPALAAPVVHRLLERRLPGPD
jgi:predicted Na+-dependent transporter